jgi:hypothetical protein
VISHVFNGIAKPLQGIAKALPMPRRLPPAETTKFRKDSKEVTKILADTLVDGLRSYHASGMFSASPYCPPQLTVAN